MNMQHLSRGKTEATCFLFLFTLSSPPFLPSPFSPPSSPSSFSSFHAGQGGKLNNHGGGKKGADEPEPDGITLLLELIYGGRIQSVPANNDRD